MHNANVRARDATNDSKCSIQFDTINASRSDVSARHVNSDTCVCAVKKHLTPTGKILMDGGVPAAGQTPLELGEQLAGVASTTCSSSTTTSRSPSPPPPRVPLDEWEERKFSSAS
jgi:hypothetical protein